MRPRTKAYGGNMKREELRSKLSSVGVKEEDLGGIVDYIMSANGADVNSLKEELSAAKTQNANSLKSIQDENTALKAQLEGYKDYEELKKFKADSLEKIETDKKVAFLKAQGCKHPDLIMAKVDFTKGQYDEESKTYTGLDDAIKGLKESYSDLFEQTNMQRIVPATQPKAGDDVLANYLKEHPEMAKFM